MNATARPDDGDDSRKVVGLLGDGWWARFAGVPRRHGATLTSAALALALVAASAWSPDEQYTRYAFRGLWGGLVFVAALVIGEGAAILSFWPRARPVWRILSWIAQRVGYPIPLALSRMSRIQEREDQGIARRLRIPDTI